MNGFFLVNKKSDWTSRDVVTKISHIFHEKKVGHSGTLDPFATGLLVVSMGKATKTSICLDGLDKEYVATLKLGGRTISGDLTNEIIETKEVKPFTKEQILEVFNSLIGKQKQTPPMVSAVRYKGQKLFHLALQGIEVERESRDIEIHELELIDFSEDTITFKAKVSKGTYIRVLGEEIAQKLGNIGYLISLNRTKVGPFNLEDAYQIEELSEDKLIDMYDALSFMPIIIPDNKTARLASHGVVFEGTRFPHHDTILIADKRHRILAIYKYENNKFTCLRGINVYGDYSV